jgi:hypothetical protein
MNIKLERLAQPTGCVAMLLVQDRVESSRLAAQRHLLTHILDDVRLDMRQEQGSRMSTPSISSTSDLFISLVNGWRVYLDEREHLVLDPIAIPAPVANVSCLNE